MHTPGWMLACRLAAVFLLAASVMVTALAPARADDGVFCGATIGADTTLTADLSQCPDDGLVVSADGVTLDLNGHTLGGSGTGSGITITGAGVTVKNGSVRNFEQGVRVAGAHAETTLTGLTVNWNGTGLFVLSEGPGVVAESKFSHNALSGIRVRSAPGVRWTVKDSAILQNGGEGIWYFDTPATVLRNKVSGNVGNGILVDTSDQSTISDNDASRNGRNGILVRDSTMQVTGNTTRHNVGSGIWLAECCGLQFAQHYLVAENVSDSNGAFGILACTVIAGSPGCAPGMIDGGGNLAKLNQQTPECLNIVCRFSPGKA